MWRFREPAHRALDDGDDNYYTRVSVGNAERTLAAQRHGGTNPIFNAST